MNQNKLASEQRFRQLAAAQLRAYRALDHSNTYKRGMKYGAYIAFKSAAWRAEWDKTNAELEAYANEN